MEEIIIGLENISDANIGKLDFCLQNNPRVNSYKILPESNSIIIYMKYDFEIPFVSQDLESNGFKIITASLQTHRKSIPLLEALTDKEAIEQEVLRENANFNLERFYVDELEGAVGVITKDKIIFASAAINHYTALNYIYNFLYNNSDKVQEYCSFNDDTYWQEEAVALGNVVIQLCSNVSSTVWLPEEMNDYQQSELNKILDQINTIRQKYNIPIDIEIDKPNNFKEEQTIEPEILQTSSKIL